MESLAILIPVAILMALLIVGVFVWAARSGQFEDLERHGSDPLFEENGEEVDGPQRGEKSAD